MDVNQWPLTIADRPFPWSVASERAALLLAENEMTGSQICEEVGYQNHGILSQWKQHPDFAARVQEHKAALREVGQRYSICKINARLKALENRWLGMKQIIEERKKDPLMKFVPGGETGLYQIRELKWYTVKDENDKETLEPRPVKWAFDKQLMQEMRAVEQHAARQMGEWIDRIEVKNDAPEKEQAGDFLEVIARMFAKAYEKKNEAARLQTIEVERDNAEPEPPG